MCRYMCMGIGLFVQWNIELRGLLNAKVILLEDSYSSIKAIVGVCGGVAH